VEDLDASTPIPGDCKAYRLIRPDWMKPGLSPPRPSSQAFQDHPRSGAMSAYLGDAIQAAGKSPSDLQKMKAWQGYWIFSLTVQQLRDEFGQEVQRDPQPDFPGHALIRDPSGRRSQGKRSKMAVRCVLEAEADGSTANPPTLLQDPALTTESRQGRLIALRRRLRRLFSFLATRHR
jgi:hypothetical protein